MARCKEDRQALFNGVLCQDKRQWAQNEMQEGPSEDSGKLVYCQDDWALVQVTQESCGVFLVGDTQKLFGHSPEQPALGGPAWTRTRWTIYTVLWVYKSCLFQSVCFKFSSPVSKSCDFLRNWVSHSFWWIIFPSTQK